MVEKRSKEKGSITVEAALVLPFFILAIYTMGMIMKLIYVHDMMQQALTETAEDIAVAGYVYEQSGLLEVQRHLDQAFKDQPDLEEKFQTMTLDVGSQLGVFSFQANEGSKTMRDEGSDLISKFKSLQTRIINLSESFSLIYTSIEDFVDQVTANSLLAPDYRKAKSYVDGAVTKLQFRRYLSNDQLKVLGIQEGAKGLEFKRSQLFYEEEGQEDLIFLVMEYQVSIPSFMNLLSEVKLVNTVKTRGWTGAGNDVVLKDKNNPSRDKKQEDQEEQQNGDDDEGDTEKDQGKEDHDEDKKKNFVYLGNRGSDGKIIYHDPEVCSRLKREEDIQTMSYENLSGESELCGRCEKRRGDSNKVKAGTTIYVTLANLKKDNPTFHTYLKCSYIYLNKSRKKIKEEVEKSSEYRSCNCL